MVAAVAFLLLLQCLSFFAQELQPLDPQGAFSSILSLSPSESEKAFAIVRQCDAATARNLWPMLMAAARKSFDAGELGKSAFLYECVAEAARESKHDWLLAEAKYRLGLTFLRSRDYQRAEESLLEGAGLSEKHNFDVGLLNNLGTLGALYIRLAKYDAAERVSKQALTRIERSPSRSLVQYQYGEATVCGNLGRIAAWNGEHTTALNYLGRAVELFEKLDKKIGGYKASALDALIGIGEVHYDLGDYRKALDYYGKVLLAAEEHGYMDLLKSVWNDLGILYMDQADFIKATEFFTKSLNAANKVGDREGASIATCNLGVSQRETGDV